MTSSPCRWTDFDPHLLEGSGVCRYGIVSVEEVDAQARRLYDDWLSAGRHGQMSYLERYGDIRNNPIQLLEGAKSMICCAIPYFAEKTAAPRGALSIARYALGRDYHDVVRKRLEMVAARIRETLGGETRVCVDTAPLRERYWAARAGVGFIGRNNQLIVPQAGSYFFLGEILTTANLRPTELPEGREGGGVGEPCRNCDRCVRACPTGALRPDGSCDASRCLSYLTIEYRGDFDSTTDLHETFYGCDRCAAACPHNSSPQPASITELLPNQKIASLTAEEIISMSQEDFAATFRGSAMKRAKLSGLRRNALWLLTPKKDAREISECLEKNA